MIRCTFCQIIAGEKPSQTVYKDEIVTAFQDIHPVAPTHILIVPNKHVTSINDLTCSDATLIGHLFMVASQLAKGEGIEKSGYRLIINTGPHANQTIYHLHLHLIGGQPMRYPMG
jgi:histidine triad (HIT) family protein